MVMVILCLSMFGIMNLQASEDREGLTTSFRGDAAVDGRSQIAVINRVGKDASGELYVAERQTFNIGPKASVDELVHALEAIMSYWDKKMKSLDEACAISQQREAAEAFRARLAQTVSPTDDEFEKMANEQNNSTSHFTWCIIQ